MGGRNITTGPVGGPPCVYTARINISVKFVEDPKFVSMVASVVSAEIAVGRHFVTTAVVNTRAGCVWEQAFVFIIVRESSARSAVAPRSAFMVATNIAAKSALNLDIVSAFMVCEGRSVPNAVSEYVLSVRMEKRNPNA